MSIGSRLTRFMITVPCQALRDVNRQSDIKFTVIFYLPLICSQNVVDAINRNHQNQSSVYHVSSNGLYKLFLVHRYLLVQRWYFVRSHFNMYAPLFSCPLLSSKLDSLVIKTLKRNSLNVKKCPSNVLITGESNFDEKNAQLIRGSFLKK